MTAKELRHKYLDFFKSKGHTIIPSDSLIPQNDPTTLFTTAGMHPLVPYLMGEDHPGGKRVANVQKCIRTTDIDEVGDATHHTFFEMMGNWSFGDSASTDGIGKAGYFKKEAIEMSWEFLTSPEWLGLDKKRLAVSVFEGDQDAPFDEESFNKWIELGVDEKRIARLPKKQNWWGPAGETGPCGPDTEMFYWVGDPDKVPESFNDDHDNWVEIWNDVFMEYEKTKDGKFSPLKQKNVDTGMGLERMLAAMNGLDDNYKTELFLPIIEKLEEISGVKYKERKKSFRIIADHIKAAVMIIGDDKGIAPSNTDQGYVVRKLIRRAIRHAKHLAINENFVESISNIIIDSYKGVYAEIGKNKNNILTEVAKEEEKFRKTLDKGIRRLMKEIFGKKVIGIEKGTGNSHFDEESKTLDEVRNKITGKFLFDIYQTDGFPLEISLEEIQNILNVSQKYDGKKLEEIIDLNLIKKDFNEEFEKHQELSRTASVGKFKGGLADSGEETKKLHTAAHLMLAALRKVLGDHVHQKGSNITAERLRFDFSHPEKLTDEQKAEVEKLVNEVIEKKVPVIVEEMSPEEAREQGAEGVFESKYGNKVKIYTVGEFSKEICGGPHVENTGELGHFKIKKEESSGAGVRRIKAVLE